MRLDASVPNTVLTSATTCEYGWLKAGLEATRIVLWPPSPAAFTLGKNEVHVWSASLSLPPVKVEELGKTLSADERARADRFHFQKDRRRFVVARGVLRAVLSRYLDGEPSELRFCYSVQGKPELATQSGEDPVRFNVSHSHELAVYAVTRRRGIGIDVEWLRPISEVAQIAKHFFSTCENAVLRTLPEHEKVEAFFACWTRKEAYVKALGDGLARPLDEFDVSLAPGDPARLLHIRGDEQEVSRWSLRELTPAFGYTATIAVEGDAWGLECWRWENEPTANTSAFY